MKKEIISKSLNEIDLVYVEEAINFSSSKKSNRLMFIKMPLVAVVLILLLFSTIAVAGINIYQNASQIKFQDGSSVQLYENVPFRKIPDTAVKSDEYSKIPMTFEQVAEILGFKILNYKDAFENEINYSTSLNKNGSIAVVDLWWASFLKESEEKYATYSARILNENADEGYVYPFIEGIDAAGGMEYNETYKINSLDVDAVIYTIGNSPYGENVSDGRVSVQFVYDNVLYKLDFWNYTNDEIKIILEELE